MYKRIVIILSVVIFSHSVFVFADTEKRGADDKGGGYESSDTENDTYPTEINTIMSESDDEDIDLIENVLNDEVLEENVGMPDVVSDNEMMGEELVSDNGILEKNEEIPDIILDNEISEDQDEGLSEIVSNDELSGEDEEEENERSDGTISGGEMYPQNEEEAIINVSVPRNIHGCLDPENISGKGGVYSDKYEIINYGNRDVVVKIKKINAFYKEDKGIYEFSENTVGDEGPNIKKMNIDMVWKNESEDMQKVLNVIDGQVDEYVLYLKASKYDENNRFVELNDGSVGTFYVRGTLNQNLDIQWNDNEIALQLDYRIQSVEKAEETVQNALAVMEEKGENEEY